MVLSLRLTAQSSTPRWLVYLELALIVAAPYVYYLMPHDFGSDGYLRLETTRYLALGQVIDQPVPLLFSILALPLYHFGDVVVLFNMAILFTGLAAMAIILWRVAPADVLRRFTLIVLAASMFGHHTQVFFGELMTAFFVAIGMALMVTGWSTLGIAAGILGAVNMPASVPALSLMLLDRAKPPYRVLKAAWPAAICAVVLMLEYYLRRGDPFSTGYEGDFGRQSILPYSGLPGFSYPFVFGVLSILFSFGKGLALFAPGLWLMLRRTADRMPDALRLFQRHGVWFLAGLVIVYAKWWAWPGGWFWGPRFFLFASIPASFALAIHLSDTRATTAAKALTVAVLAWSAWVGISGAVYGQNEMGICSAEANIEPLCWYAPEFSALFRPFIVPKALNTSERIVFAYSVVAAVVLAIPFGRDLLRSARHIPGVARRWLFA